MSLLSIFLLALALSIDSFIVSVTVGLQKNITTKRGLFFSFLCAFIQGILPLMGIFLGSLFKSGFEKYDHWIAFGLLVIIGSKMLFEVRKAGKSEDAINTLKTSILIGLAIATSIDAFVVGIGLGLELTSIQEEIVAVSIIALLTFIMASIGIFLGRRNKFIPAKFATFLAGLVLIGLGIKVLIEHNAF